MSKVEEIVHVPVIKHEERIIQNPVEVVARPLASGGGSTSGHQLTVTNVVAAVFVEQWPLWRDVVREC